MVARLAAAAAAAVPAATTPALVLHGAGAASGGGGGVGVQKEGARVLFAARSKCDRSVLCVGDAAAEAVVVETGVLACAGEEGKIG